MIAYSIIILVSWVGSIFIPFFFVGFEDKNSRHKHQKDAHFLRG